MEAKFTVSILARKDSTSEFPSGLTVHRTDFSPESLLAAFKGQDAVVSTIGAGGQPQQNAIVDAAAQAGVKRFIPSAFGSNTLNAKAVSIVPFFKGKNDVVDYLEKTVASHPGFTWSSILTGGFFDWGLKNGFLGFDVAKKTATIYNDGNRRASYTTLATIGRAVAGTLLHPSETANKHVYVASFTVTQNEILAALEAATSAKWTVTKQTSEAAVKEGHAKLAAKDIAGGVPLLLLAQMYDAGTGNDFEKEVEGGVANSVLQLPKETLDAAIKDVLTN